MELVNRVVSFEFDKIKLIIREKIIPSYDIITSYQKGWHLEML